MMTQSKVQNHRGSRVAYPIEDVLRQQTIKALAEAIGELRYAIGLVGPQHSASTVLRKVATDLDVVLDAIKD